MPDKHKTENDEKEVLQKVVAGEIAFRNIDKVVGDVDSAVAIRRNALEEITGTKFKNIQHYTLDAEAAAKRNIENMIGSVQIPLGIAGPLKIKGEFAQGDFYLPLATTEGALVASANRGCSAISSSGGANVRIFQDVMTRAPVFRLDDVVQAKAFIDWISRPEIFTRMKEKAEETTRFGKLLAVEPYVTGNTVYLRFIYDTKDAMGMNMVTIATEAVTHLIQDEFGAIPVSLSGNMCIDKKPAAINTILGRGKTVVADTTIPAKIVSEKLKCKPETMADVNYRKNLLGSARAGALGFNAHSANIVAALFLA